MPGALRAETETGEAMRALLDAQGLPAHVSGLDVLLPFCNQFYFAAAHLVVCQEGCYGEVSFELAHRVERPLAVVRSWRDVMLGDFDNLVVLREADVPEIDGALADPVRAWLESYRAIDAGAYPLSANELGQMVRRPGDGGVSTWGVAAADILAQAGKERVELERAFRGDVDDQRSAAGGVWGGLSDPY